MLTHDQTTSDITQHFQKVTALFFSLLQCLINETKEDKGRQKNRRDNVIYKLLVLYNLQLAIVKK